MDESQPGRDSDAHNGHAILTLGIVSLVLACCPLVGGALGLAAAIWGLADLHKMVGSGDNRWIGQSLAGTICGFLGTILSAVVLCLYIQGYPGPQNTAGLVDPKPNMAGTLKHGTAPPIENSTRPNGKTFQPKLSRVEIHFDKEQRFEGLELFIDDKVQDASRRVQPFGPSKQHVQLQLAAGSHAIKVHWHGKEVWANKVQVKPADQGVTVVKVPELDDPEAPGTLVLNFVGPDAVVGQRVELFIDGKLIDKGPGLGLQAMMAGGPGGGAGATVLGYGKKELPLLPGKHTVALKKYAIEVYSGTVDVNKPRDGKTFLQINLVVTGTVLIKNARPIGLGVYARVCVDQENPAGGLGLGVGGNGKLWPVGNATIELTTEPGTRVISVYMAPPGTPVGAIGVINWNRIETFTVQVKPGKQTVVNMKK